MVYNLEHEGRSFFAVDEDQARQRMMTESSNNMLKTMVLEFEKLLLFLLRKLRQQPATKDPFLSVVRKAEEEASELIDAGDINFVVSDLVKKVPSPLYSVSCCDADGQSFGTNLSFGIT